MDIDPRLRDVSSRGPEPYDQGSTYALNPIRLPLPQQPGLPPLAQDGSQPYFTYRQPQPGAVRLPPSDQSPRNGLSYPTSAGDEPTPDAKRLRACEACRGLKVRCEPDPVKGTCRRCAKAGRTCIITVPSRKRQKKTDSKVAELEKKIDALTASLHATKSQGQTDSESETFEDNASQDQRRETSRVEDYHSNRRREGIGQDGAYLVDPRIDSKSHYTTSASNRKRRRTLGTNDQRMGLEASESSLDDGLTGNGGPTVKMDDSVTASAFTAIPSPMAPLDPSLPSHEFADVVDRKLLDASTAADIFYHYTTNMAIHMPCVAFPSNVTAGEIRRSKPIIFLAILGVAAGQDHPELQRRLLRELTKVLADSIICKGEKSIELIQALQVATIWYWPEDHKDSRPYQLIHMAAVMCMAMGLARKEPTGKSALLGFWRHKNAVLGPRNIESRRAWLSCYLICAKNSICFRQNNIIRWDAYLEDCLEHLESSQEALPSDPLLCQWVRLQRIADDIGTLQDIQEDSLQTGSDERISKALRIFEKRLDAWKLDKPKAIKSTALTLGGHTCGLYAHLVATRFDSRMEDSKAPQLSGDYKTDPEKAHANDPSTYVSLLHNALDTFLKMSVEDIRSIPIFHFVRITYAMVLLLRLHFAKSATVGDTQVDGRSVDTRAAYYLQQISTLLKAAAAEDKCRPAQNFFLFLMMLKTYFERQARGKSSQETHRRESKIASQPIDTEHNTPRLGYRQISMDMDQFSPNGDSENASRRRGKSETQDHQAQHAQQQQQLATPHPSSMASTPLHLLSQIATGEAPHSGTPVQNHPYGTPQAQSQNQNQNQSRNQNAGGESWYPYPDQIPTPAHNGVSMNEFSNQSPYYGSSHDHQQQQRQQEQQQQATATPYQNDAYQNLDPGLEQAMGMTFGEGPVDLDTLLMDDSFINIMQAQSGLVGGHSGGGWVVAGGDGGDGVDGLGDM